MKDLDSIQLPVKDFEDNYLTLGPYLLVRDPDGEKIGRKVYSVTATTNYGHNPIATVVENKDKVTYTIYPNSMVPSEKHNWVHVSSTRAEDLLQELSRIEKDHETFWKMMEEKYGQYWIQEKYRK
jgi:hypothetical protein